MRKARNEATHDLAQEERDVRNQRDRSVIDEATREGDEEDIRKDERRHEEDQETKQRVGVGQGAAMAGTPKREWGREM